MSGYLPPQPPRPPRIPLPQPAPPQNMHGAQFPDPARPSSPRRRSGWLLTTVSVIASIVIYGIGIVSSMLGLTAAPWAFAGKEVSNLGAVIVLLLFPMWATVFLRRRWPWVTFITGAVLALGWGDCFLMLIGMFHLLIRGSRRSALIAGISGSIVTVASVLRMCLGPTALNPFTVLFVPADAEPARLDVPSVPADAVFGINVVTVLAGVIGLAVSIGFGLLLRRTRRMRAVEAFATKEVQRNEVLSAEIARQSERELLARELHDTLSHRLSVISLHSGALEVGSQDDADVAATASALRHEAHASLEELRDLVSGVRAGNLAHAAAPRDANPPMMASMLSLPQLIESVQATGTVVHPAVIIADAEKAPMMLDRAVYRIVQESLTNAMKHAPGAPVTVRVSAAAGTGVRITISNPVAAQPPDGPSSHGLQSTGSGVGLEGIRERVDVLGGRAEIGVREGAFVVDVTLPPFNGPTGAA